MTRCDRVVRYEGTDAWGNARSATYPCPAGATPPRTLVRLGCVLTRVEVPASQAANESAEWLPVTVLCGEPIVTPLSPAELDAAREAHV